MSTVVSVNRVRKAFVKQCMAEGIDNQEDLFVMASKMINSIGSMSIAAYKAHETMRRQRIAKRSKSKHSCKSCRCL